MPKLLFNKLTLFIVIPIVAIILVVNYVSPTTFQSLLNGNVKGASTLTDAELRAAGLYDVTAFGADPEGKKDSTRAIQDAIDAALKVDQRGHDQRGVVFFPEGEYMISNTLRGLQNREQARYNAVYLLGSTKGQRPKIVLKAGAFNDGNNGNNGSMNGKKAMVHLWTCDGEPKKGCIPQYSAQVSNVNKADGGRAMGMSNGIANLEFVIKDNNPDAIGIRFAAAQNNVISNVKISSEGESYAGLYSMIGTDSVVQDLEIDGGKIGIHGGATEFPTFSNVKLTNQTVAAIAGIKGAGPLSLNGFYIEKATAPIITDEPIGYAYNTFSNSGGAYALSDGVIKIRTASQTPVFDNADKQLTLQNVYIQNAPVIAKSRNQNVTGSPSGWLRVNVYAKVMEDFLGNSGIRYENGRAATSDLVRIDTSGVREPNANALMAKHGVARAKLPSPDVIMERSKAGDPAYVNITDRGIRPSNSLNPSAPEYRQEFQNILNDNRVKYILVPRGVFLINGTLDVKRDVAIIGIGNFVSELRSHPSRNTSGQEYFIRTEDSKDAGPTFAFLRIATDVGPNKRLGNIHIRSGKTLMYATMTRAYFSTEGILHTFQPRNKIYMSDNAGGKFYGLGTGGAGFASQWYPGFRGINVQGTRNPITFYAANPEDGGYVCPEGTKDFKTCRPNTSSQQIEIRNARNIAFRGFKCEDYNSLNIYNTQNVFVNGGGGCLDWLFDNVDQSLVLNLASKFNGSYSSRPNEGGKMMYEEKFSGSNYNVRMRQALAAAQRGALPDFSVWETGDTTPPPPPPPPPPADPVCGNGVKEQGEACDLGSGNGVCPATCSSTCTVNTCDDGGGDDEDPELGQRIVLNGNFTMPADSENELAKYWYFATGNLGKSTATLTRARNTDLAKGEAVRIDITKNPTIGMPTLYQRGIDMEPNTEYVVSFVARSSAPGRARIMFRDLGYIKEQIAPTVSFELKEGWNLYSTTIVSKKFNANKAGLYTLGISLPNDSNIVIDNVIVVPVLPGPIKPAQPSAL